MKILVTGGSGFIGSALVRALLAEGHAVRSLDNNSRGRAARLADIAGDIEIIEGDIRDPSAVSAAVRGVDSVHHFAYINGTEWFYKRPELVLEVAVRGMLNVLDACVQHGVGELLLASSSEVYQTPPVVPTDETVPLSVPDPLNPRYSYGGGKIISELLAINWGRKLLGRVLIVRPHNVYGPDMGWEHVIPQFVMRMRRLQAAAAGPVSFPIQGDGRETRSFVYVDDFVAGTLLVARKGTHLGIYHVGTKEEVPIAQIAHLIGDYFGRVVQIVPGALTAGSTTRRCPDIRKVSALGYTPRVGLADGLARTARWYDQHAALEPARADGPIQ